MLKITVDLYNSLVRKKSIKNSFFGSKNINFLINSPLQVVMKFLVFQVASVSLLSYLFSLLQGQNSNYFKWSEKEKHVFCLINLVSIFDFNNKYRTEIWHLHGLIPRHFIIEECYPGVCPFKKFTKNFRIIKEIIRNFEKSMNKHCTKNEV